MKRQIASALFTLVVGCSTVQAPTVEYKKAVGCTGLKSYIEKEESNNNYWVRNALITIDQYDRRERDIKKLKSDYEQFCQ
jgi:hypothetical protein